MKQQQILVSQQTLQMDLPRPQLWDAGPSVAWPLQACTPPEATGQAAASPAPAVVAHMPTEVAMRTADMAAPALLQPPRPSDSGQPGGAAHSAARQNNQPTRTQLMWRKAQARYKERKVGSNS